MHQTAENGIAAHWLYKSGVAQGRGEDEGALPHQQAARVAGRPGRSRGISSTRSRRSSSGTRSTSSRPRGTWSSCPYGSTAIDFAYHIHTDIGDHCTGAKADGAIIPLKEPLKNTQVVEIMTSKTAHPHLDWLRYVKTSKARSKVKHWLAQNEPGPDLRPQHRGPQDRGGPAHHRLPEDEAAPARRDDPPRGSPPSRRRRSGTRARSPSGSARNATS